MTELDKEQIRHLLKGASFLTTGGGLCFEEQNQLLQTRDNISICLKSLNEFDDNDILVTAAEVGPADAPEIEKAGILPAMLDMWTRMTGHNVAGVYPTEIGQEMIVIDTAAAMNVPIADFDPAGGRAVPFVDISSFRLANIEFSYSPMVVATDRGDILAVDTKTTPEQAEDTLRAMSRLSKHNIIYFIGGAIRAGNLKNKGLDNRSLSLSHSLGDIPDTDALAATLATQQILTGRVTDKQERAHNGFNCFTATFDDEKNSKSYMLYILNEVLFLKDAQGNMVCSAPDKILLIDHENMKGLSSAELLTGKPATLMLVKADPLWQSEKAKALFGEERFPFLLAA